MREGAMGKDAKRLVMRSATLITAALIITLSLSGCGIQRREVNQALENADKIQEEVEARLEVLTRFPDEWASVFSSGVNQQSIAKAGELVRARLAELEALEPKMKKLQAELKKILGYNIDETVKEYARLRISAADIYSEYISDDLWTLFKTYEGLLGKIAARASREELDAAAKEIVDLVGKAVEKLEECKGAAKQADEYFLENSLDGKT